MAETDIRLETLEDEVKVLKGEVKRTLVDLRALLMREDSPLGEGGIARRMVLPGGGGSNEAVRGVEEAVGQRVMEPAATAEVDLQPGPGPGPGPGAMPTPPAPPGPPPVGGPPTPEGEGPALKHEPGESLEAPAEEDQVQDEDHPEREEGPVQRAKPRAGRNGRSKLLGYGGDAGEEAPTGDEGKSRPVTGIYDEYRELLEEPPSSLVVEEGPAGPPLDVNLLSNLVYWAALAKQRVGEEQLKEILQLYIQSGHSRPELQDLLLHICSMVEGDPMEEDDGGDWVDLMFHLHGILTGGFPVVKIPRVRLPQLGGSREEEGD